jgi:pilus assembly protein Flp/PilA
MGEARQIERVSDAASRRSACSLAARLSLSLQRLWGDESGATAVEYGLIVSCIFLAILGGLSLFAGNENTMYQHISNAIGGATR